MILGIEHDAPCQLVSFPRMERVPESFLRSLAEKLKHSGFIPNLQTDANDATAQALIAKVSRDVKLPFEKDGPTLY